MKVSKENCEGCPYFEFEGNREERYKDNQKNMIENDVCAKREQGSCERR